MKIRSRLMLAACLLGLGQFALAASPQQSAQQLIEQLQAGQFSAAEARFSPQMAQAVPAARLAQLWQALNQQLGQNFFEFVNGFRIAAAERCLADPGDQRSILDIALACGFGSKSTFNAVFKRMTGLTPTAFRSRAIASDPTGSNDPTV